MTSPNQTDHPIELSRRLSRRAFLRKSVAFGALSVGGATLLSACWPFGDDDEDDDVDDETVDDADATPEMDATPEPTPDPEPTPTPEATPTPEPTPTPTPITPPDEPVTGGTLRIALPADPFSLHPNADESVTNWVVMSQIYDALMEVDHQFEPQQVLAQNIDIAEDGSAYTFTIPDDVLFHNGSPLTASDVVFSHEWMRAPENGAARSFYYERVDSIQADDDVTITFTMSSPDGTFLRRAASTFIVNEEFHEEFGWERQSLEPVGTGPFALDSWVRGTSLRLVRFEEYFGGAPYIDEIELSVRTESGDRRSALEDGRADITWDLPINDDLELADTDGMQAIEVTNLDCLHIALNNEHPVLAHRNVRLAMQYAIDRAALIDAVYDGEATEAASYISPAVFQWHQEMFEQGRVETDLAIQLLEEAQFTEGDDGIRERDGERLSFTCVAPDGGDPRADGAELIAEMLVEVGIEMEVETAPLTETLPQMREGELDAAIFNWTYGGWLGEPDGRTTLLTGAFNNFSQFSSIQVDNVLYQGVALVDQEDRRAIYRNLQERILDQSPFIFLAFPHDWYHASIRVQGLPDSVRWGSRAFRKLAECWVFDVD
jgi:peptide/nickel transport system substrate-binding protein